MSKHVTILGGGIIGLCCAYYLRQQGHMVRVIDQSSIGNSCAKGNAGYISPSHFIPLASPGMIKQGLRWMFNPESPFYIKPRFDLELFSWLWKFNQHCSHHHVSSVKHSLLELCTRSSSLFETLWEELEHSFQFKRNGLHVVCQTQSGKHEELDVLSQAHKLGINAKWIEASDYQQYYPDMPLDILGGVYYPQDSHVQPGEFMAALHQSLLQQNVEIIENCQIDRIKRTNDQITSINCGTTQFEIDELVLAAGAWSNPIARQLNLKIPVQAGKGYSVTIEKPWDVSTPLILNEARVAITPFEKQIRFGGTMELSGIDLSINPRRIQGILKSVKRFIPSFDPNWINPNIAWTGLRPCSPDGLPIIGRPQQYRNLVVATGHAMLGLTLAPVTGQIVANMISNEEADEHQSRISPDRFS